MPTLKDIEAARLKLADIVHHTALLPSRTFSALTSSQLYLKAENTQRTGSFKLRGAYNKLSSLSPAERTRGVVAASAGNHAQGVAVAARATGIAATVVMPETAALAKVTATRNYGATVVLHGQTYDQAFEHSLSLQREQGAVFVHPFDDAMVIAGQGTIGLEILADLPEVEAIVVPVGGGGLISGIAIAAKETRPAIRVYGVQAAGSDSAYRSLRSGTLQCSLGPGTIADGIAIKCCGERTLGIMRRYVDDIVLVEDEDISEAMVLLLERAKLVVEGGGAAGLAALVSGRLSLPGQRVAVVLSGGNVDVNLLARIIEHGLTKAGRYLTVRLTLVDQPGQLAGLAAVLAAHRVNILDIEHHRTGVGIPIGHVEVELTLETRDFAHAEEVITSLAAHGYTAKKVT